LTFTAGDAKKLTMSRIGAALVIGLALLAGLAPVQAKPPAPLPITPELIAAAGKEGRIVWYTSAELGVVEAIAKAFEAKYPGTEVAVERSGAERNFQRLAQEYGSGIHSADVIDSSDATHFLFWKKAGFLTPFIPQEVADHIPAEFRDPDGYYATWRATLSVMGYNTNLVKPEEAPKSFADLLDAKWKSKLVKAHPGYSGTILTSTYALVHSLGWPYLEALGKQDVMQVQSANDPPRKVEAGERAVMVDGVEYLVTLEKQRGAPIEPIYPIEGTPFIPGSVGVAKEAPHPNAARLFESYLFSAEAQQLNIDKGALRSVHSETSDPPGRMPLKDIKLLKDNPAGAAAEADEIKKRYSQDFGI
jgi:iron(III) transport system substrate-binding protein